MDLTVTEAASLLRVSEKTIYRWIQRRTIPAYRIGGQYRFRRQELLSWAGSRRIVVAPGSFGGGAEEKPPTVAQALKAGGIYYRVGGVEKSEVLTRAVSLLRLPEQVNREYVLSELLAREDLGSTGVGGGIALPHIRTPITPDLPRPFVAICFLENPVDFGALDRVQVTALIIVLSPSVRSHLHLMSELSFVLRDERVHAAMQQQAGRDDLLRAVRAAEQGLALEAPESELESEPESEEDAQPPEAVTA